MDNPFQIFPEELCDVILEELDDSEDIINILEAWPQIIFVSQGKQFSWRFGQILPLIFPKLLNLSDLKLCRQVSRRWNNAISTCLKNHPDRHPCKSTGSAGTFPGNDFSYKSLPNTVANLSTFVKFGFSPAQLCSALPTSNPFPGNSVYAAVTGDFGRNSGFDILWEQGDSGLTINEVLPIFKLYGAHIVHMTFMLQWFLLVTDNDLLEDVIKPICEALALLPNLKSLTLNCASIDTLKEISGDKCNRDMVNFLRDFTPPAKLEILDLSNFISGDISQDLHNRLVAAFVRCNELRKLSINCAHFKSDYVSLFPNILELCLSHCGMPAFANNLRDLESVPILKLCVGTSELIMGEIISALRPLKIESLEIIGEIQETHYCNISNENEIVSVPSITCLKLQVTEKLGLQFLNRFPALQFISVEILYMDWDGNVHDSGENGVHFDGDIFRKCLHTFYYTARYSAKDLGAVFQDIWNEFPSLKMITINLLNTTYQFVRECRHKVFISSNV